MQIANFTELQYENKTQQFLKKILRYKRHFDFVRNVEEVESCFRPVGFQEHIEQSCKFIKRTPSCYEVASLINYLKLYVCTLGLDASTGRGVPFIIMGALIVSLYFIWLFVIAKYFLLPNSIVLANYFNMINYDFGNVVLGLLFTMPFHMTMIFSCFTYNKSDSLMHATTYGKSFTCLVIGLGLLSYRRSFHLIGTILLREMVFLVVAAIYLYAAVYNEMINFNFPPQHRKERTLHIHALLILGIYLIYLLNIILLGKKRNPNTAKNLEPEAIPSSSATIESDTFPDLNKNVSEMNLQRGQIFFESINPWTLMDISHAYSRMILAPFFVLTACFIPVVDSKRTMNGWCKWIVVLSVLIFPFYFLILHFNMGNIIFLCLVAITAAMCLIFLTKSTRIPCRHELVSFWALAIGCCIFNIIDLEICCILWQFLSYVMDMKRDVIMLVAFPLSHIFVESVIVLTLLENGYCEMALGFVMGTVLSVTYAGLPVMIFSYCISDIAFFSLTDNTTTAYYILLITIFVSLFGLSVNGYELRPSISIFFFMVTAIFTCIMLLVNAQLIHPYGTVHSLTIFVDVMHSQWT